MQRLTAKVVRHGNASPAAMTQVQQSGTAITADQPVSLAGIGQRHKKQVMRVG